MRSFPRDQFETIPAHHIQRGYHWMMRPDRADWKTYPQMEAMQVERYVNSLFNPEYLGSGEEVCYMKVDDGFYFSGLYFPMERKNLTTPKTWRNPRTEWCKVYIHEVGLYQNTEGIPHSFAIIACIFTSNYPVQVLKQEYIPKERKEESSN